MDLNSYFNCFNRCFGFGLSSGSSYSVVKEPLIPAVVLDTSRMGNDVVIVKNGHRICGTGAALACQPIVQNKAYFEVKVQQSGIWGIGLATEHANLGRVPLGHDIESWVLRCDGTIVHNNEVLFRIRDLPQEGDIISVTYDHLELKFYLNDVPLEYAVTSTKSKGSEIFPVVYVDDGAILDVAFTTFTFQPPQGFDRILVEKSLL